MLLLKVLETQSEKQATLRGFELESTVPFTTTLNSPSCNRGVMVSKLDFQNFNGEFNSHWISY